MDGNELPRRGLSLDELHQQLADAVAKLQTGEQWQAYLDFASRLHRYSFKNLILIWTQRPDATAVASYRTWQALNRQVRRGEHALRVIAPITRRPKNHSSIRNKGRTSRSAVDAAPATSLPADSQAPSSATSGERIVGFRAVPVFDISQTDGPPLPQQPEAQLLTQDLADGTAAGLWDALADEVAARGYRLLRGSLDDLRGANGVTKIIEREVWVRDDVSPAQATKTLAHELGHILLHTTPNTVDNNGAPAIDAGVLDSLRCAGIREVEAESVAHLVLAHHGIDTGSYTFPYVASWAHPIASAEQVPIGDVITRVGTRVTKAAAELIDATTATVDVVQDPAVAAVAARVAASTAQGADLHDRAVRHRDQVAPAPDAALTVQERRALLGVVADSNDYYRRHVDQSWVRPYLDSRGFATAVDPYGIGYAPAGWTGLVDHLRSLGYTDGHIETAGMASRTRSGQLIDRFRDRLTIPLHDTNNDLVAFTARTNPTADDRDPEGPKYLNSATTPLYRKREVLFGLRNQAPMAIAPVVCEGALDAIAIDLAAGPAGLQVYGVASIGTAFTEPQAELIRSAAGWLPVHLAFDSDLAGRRAVENAWRQLTTKGPHDVRVVELPTGTDPATLAVERADELTAALKAHSPRPR